MSVLSREKQEGLCADRLPWAENLVRKRLGPDAVEYAGEGLYQALQTWDGEQSLDAWSAITVLNVARNRRDQFRGRPGRHAAKRMGQASLSDLDPSQLDLSQAHHHDPASRMVHDEDLHRSLLTVEQLDEESLRWSLLGQLLGGYPATAANRIAHRCGAKFDDLVDLVDGIMLFGGQIQPGKTDASAPRLAIKRVRSQWQALPWFIAVIEQTGLLRMRLSCGPDRVRDHLLYKSPAWRFLRPMDSRWPSAHRWHRGAYDRLSEATLVMWLVGAIYRSDRRGRIRMPAPPLGYRKNFSLIYQCRDHGVPVASRGRGRLIEIPASRRAEAEAWLEQRVPACVWKRS